MATPISVKSGSVTLPTVPVFLMDVQSFDAIETQQVEDTSPYGANVYARFTGSGTPMFNATVRGYSTKGSGAGVSDPGFGKMAASGGDVGGSMTLTIDTGITLIFLGIARSVRISHSRVRGGVPAEIDFVQGGDVAKVWA